MDWHSLDSFFDTWLLQWCSSVTETGVRTVLLPVEVRSEVTILEHWFWMLYSDLLKMIG